MLGFAQEHIFLVLHEIVIAGKLKINWAHFYDKKKN